MTSNASIPNCNDSKHEIIFIRQESRVRAIHPDEEHEPFLKATSPKQCRNSTELKENEKDNELNKTRELKVNGNLVIYMPSKDEPCTENMKYQNERGLVTPVSFDHVDGPQFPKKKSASKCSCFKPQTYVNIALALACAVALLVGVWSFVKNNIDNDDTGNKYLYCYSCRSTTNIKEKYKKDNMCCIKEPIKNFKVRPKLFFIRNQYALHKISIYCHFSYKFLDFINTHGSFCSKSLDTTDEVILKHKHNLILAEVLTQ